ncbi:hypothetical protein BGW42_000936 [Actinomortierella wolfii]|nr:hypothetical protein BGW42_000936 [Actinomortierella wolfii]
MPPNPIDIIVSIPEFQIALRAVLTRRELFNTILVSKHWYQALLAAYWHTLEIGALLTDPPSELVGQVGHLVHSLTLNKYTALELYAQHCTELRELTVKTFNITSPTLSKHWPWLITLLQQNPRLYTFHLNLRNKLVGPVSHVVKAFSTIPHLTTASLITSTPLDTNLILDLLVQCPLLQYLTVGSMFTIHVLPSDPYFATLGRDVMFPHLRRLNVSSVFGYDMIREILIPVWRRAPQIEAFPVPFDIRFGREFLDELQALNGLAVAKRVNRNSPPIVPKAEGL